MKTIELQANKREITNKKNLKSLRKNGMIPCVLYGGEKNINFIAKENDIIKLIYTSDVYLVNLNIDGENHKAIIKETQFHPVSDKIIHIDFYEIFDNKPFVVEIPVKLTGSSIGLKAGGKLQLKERKLKVKGLLKDIPENLEIDITNLNVGQSYKVKDLKFKNLQIIEEPQKMVVKVATTRLAKEAAEANAESK